jgi:Domain of unknown function (DUF4143)
MARGVRGGGARRRLFAGNVASRVEQDVPTFATPAPSIASARSLPAWSTNLGARIVRSARTYVADAGLLAHLLGASAETFRHDLAGDVVGRLLETFAVDELVRQSAWSTTAVGDRLVRGAVFYTGTATDAAA